MVEETQDKIKFSVYVDKDLHAKVKDLAASDDRSMNSLINKLLRDYVKNQGGK